MRWPATKALRLRAGRLPALHARELEEDEPRVEEGIARMSRTERRLIA